MKPGDIQTLLEELGQRPIAYHPSYARISGSVAAGILLSQAMYWSTRGDSYGWFWKTYDQWHDELGLTRTELTNATNKLKGIGVLDVERRGIPARNYYRVDKERLALLLSGGAPDLNLDDLINVYGTTLNQLSKAGLIRGKKANVETEYVDYREVLKEHGMTCHVCTNEIRYGPGKSGPMLVFDHVIPLVHGGTHTYDNIRPAHASCNGTKGAEILYPYANETGVSSVDKPESLGQRNIHTETTAETTTEITLSLEDEFNTFWENYPRKEGKADARKAWHQLHPSPSLMQDIGLALIQQIGNNWYGRDRQYIPLPATWIRGKRWEDEIVSPRTNGNGRKVEYYNRDGSYTVEGSIARAKGEI